MILAVDAASKTLSLALSESNGKVISSIDRELAKDTSSLLFYYLDTLLSTANKVGVRCDIGDIKLCLLGSGPGSFTGLRIGATLLQSIRLILKVPIMCIPTLALLALKKAYYIESIYTWNVALIAKKKFAYFASYKRDDLISLDSTSFVNSEKIISIDKIWGGSYDLNSNGFLGDAWLYPSQSESVKEGNIFPINFLQAKDLIWCFSLLGWGFELSDDSHELKYVGFYI